MTSNLTLALCVALLLPPLPFWIGLSRCIPPGIPGRWALIGGYGLLFGLFGVLLLVSA